MFTYDAIRARIPAGTASQGAQRRAGRNRVLIATTAGPVSRVRAAVAYRHDAYVRREIADRHERLAHLREVGGDFSVSP